MRIAAECEQDADQKKQSGRDLHQRAEQCNAAQGGAEELSRCGHALADEVLRIIVNNIGILFASALLFGGGLFRAILFTGFGRSGFLYLFEARKRTGRSQTELRDCTQNREHCAEHADNNGDIVHCAERCQGNQSGCGGEAAARRDQNNQRAHEQQTGESEQDGTACERANHRPAGQIECNHRHAGNCHADTGKQHEYNQLIEEEQHIGEQQAADEEADSGCNGELVLRDHRTAEQRGDQPCAQHTAGNKAACGAEHLEQTIAEEAQQQADHNRSDRNRKCIRRAFDHPRQGINRR